MSLSLALGPQKNQEEGTDISHIPAAPTGTAPARAPTAPISTSPPVGHLLELINLHWHVLIIQSPPLTWGLILGVVKSTGSDKCVTGPSFACRSEWFCCPNNPLLSHSFLPPPPLIFLLSPQFCLFRVSYSWNHKVLICTHLFLRFLIHSLKRKIFIENVLCLMSPKWHWALNFESG